MLGSREGEEKCRERCVGMRKCVGVLGEVKRDVGRGVG